MPLSVVALMVPVLVPPVLVNTTVRPPELKVLPFESWAMTVSIEAVLNRILAKDTVTSDCDKLRGPGVTVMVGKVLVIALPPMVALMVVAVPATIPVKLEVYLPLFKSVVAEIFPVLVPPDTENRMVSPPAVNWLPLASFAVTVMVTLELDATVPAETVTVD